MITAAIHSYCNTYGLAQQELLPNSVIQLKTAKKPMLNTKRSRLTSGQYWRQPEPFSYRQPEHALAKMYAM